MALKDIAPEHQPRKVCEGCPYGGPRVGSKGNIASPLVIVGESPGSNEKRTGIPFSGDSGILLHKFLPESFNPYVLNAMECSPPPKHKEQKRMTTATIQCSGRLLEQVKRHPRRLIVALGNQAVRSLTGDHSLKITQIRGRLIPSSLAELGILPIVHPAALMRGTGNFRQFKDDLLYARHLMEGGDPATYQPPTYEPVLGDCPTFPWPNSQWSKVLEFFQSRAVDGGVVGADIETTGLRHKTDRILNFGVTDHIGNHVYIFQADQLQFLKSHLENPKIRWGWHNGKFDVKFFREIGIQARVDEDTLLQSYTLDERGGIHDLETVAGDTLDAPDYKYMIQPYLPKKDSSYELIPTDVLSEYNAIDVSNTARIHCMYRPRVQEDPSLEKLYTKTLIPASELLANVERNGLYVDRDWLEFVDEYLIERVTTAKSEVQKCAGWSINPASPPQMSKCLYKQFKLPDRFKGSTDKDAIKWFLEREPYRLPIVHALQEFRVAAKAYGTYVKGVYKHIHEDSRVYPTFLIHGTVTGRLSCREPNLQNIPRDWIIRGMFAAPDGKILLEIDLSQAELRSLAALSGDPFMVDVYNSGRSLHKELAVSLFGEAWKECYADREHPQHQEAYEQYTRCKNVNFGIIYGVTKYGLADQIRKPPAEAQVLLDGWAKRFPKAWEFIQRCRATASKKQVLTTTFGRKKRVYLITNENLHFLENEAANFPHQSIASDITLHAAMRCEPTLRTWGVKIVNLIHDSILMELPNDPSLIAKTAKLVAGTMEQVPKDWGITRVPFVAEAATGSRWGKENLEDYDLAKAA